MICVTTILRRQWTDRERFSFPIVQIPAEVAAASAHPAGSLLASPFLWLGMSVPVGVHLMNGLSRHIPAVPSIPLLIPLEPLLHSRPFSELQPLALYIVFAVIGFGFLIPLEISFLCFTSWNVVSARCTAASLPADRSHPSEPRASLPHRSRLDRRREPDNHLPSLDAGALVWFPLHPLGFAFAGSYAMYTVWFSFGLGWGTKLLVNRYRGMKGFLLLCPFCLDLILEDGLMASFWSVVSTFTHVPCPAFSGIS